MRASNFMNVAANWSLSRPRLVHAGAWIAALVVACLTTCQARPAAGAAARSAESSEPRREAARAESCGAEPRSWGFDPDRVGSAPAGRVVDVGTAAGGA